MKRLLSYAKLLLVASGLIALLLVNRSSGLRALSLSWTSAGTMLSILPPILVLVHLFDVWVPRERVVRHMGADSGIAGAFWALALGAVAAGPLYVAFPIVAMLIRKGARFANGILLLGAWSTIKAPILLYELSFFGAAVTLLHVITGLTIVWLAALWIEKKIPIALQPEA